MTVIKGGNDNGQNRQQCPLSIWQEIIFHFGRCCEELCKKDTDTRPTAKHKISYSFSFSDNQIQSIHTAIFIISAIYGSQIARIAVER